MKKFLTLEMLLTLPYSCANRDSTNSPKTAQYPGGLRGRISSQSFKRQQRIFMKNAVINEDFTLATRSRILPKIIITAMDDYENTEGVKVFENKELKEKEDVVSRFFDDFLGLPTGRNPKEDWDQRTKNILAFNPETAIAILLPLVEEFSTAPKGKTATLSRNSVDVVAEVFGGRNLIDQALFGEMLAFAKNSIKVEGAVSVAQGVTVHPIDVEFDFWTAMGDFASDEHSGSENMGTTAFTHGVFYFSQTLDLELLRKNLPEFSEEDIQKVIKLLVESFYNYKPQAKRTNSAPFAEPVLVLANVSDKQVNHSTEFYAVPVDYDSASIEKDAANRLINRAITDNKMFNSNNELVLLTSLNGLDTTIEKEDNSSTFIDKIISKIEG